MAKFTVVLNNVSYKTFDDTKSAIDYAKSYVHLSSEGEARAHQALTDGYGFRSSNSHEGNEVEIVPVADTL